MNDTFVEDYQRMVGALARIIDAYPPEMRDALRAYAGQVLDARLQEMWRDRLRARLIAEEWTPTRRA